MGDQGQALLGVGGETTTTIAASPSRSIMSARSHVARNLESWSDRSPSNGDVIRTRREMCATYYWFSGRLGEDSAAVCCPPQRRWFSGVHSLSISPLRFSPQNPADLSHFLLTPFTHKLVLSLFYALYTANHRHILFCFGRFKRLLRQMIHPHFIIHRSLKPSLICNGLHLTINFQMHRHWPVRLYSEPITPLLCAPIMSETYRPTYRTQKTNNRAIFQAVVGESRRVGLLRIRRTCLDIDFHYWSLFINRDINLKIKLLRYFSKY